MLTPMPGQETSGNCSMGSRRAEISPMTTSATNSMTVVTGRAQCGVGVDHGVSLRGMLSVTALVSGRCAAVPAAASACAGTTSALRSSDA